MLAPAGLPHFPALVSATALLAVLAPLDALAAEPRNDAQRAIHTGLPRYDPSAYEKAQAEKAARATPKNAPGVLPETKPAVAAPASTAQSDHALELPKVTVRPDTKVIAPLPRQDAPKPLKDLKSEPFESATGRDARLIKKHVSKLTQALNFKAVQLALAHEDEARELKAPQMNELATSIEIQAAIGRDPEEIKKLRAEYLKLYYSGPKK